MFFPYTFLLFFPVLLLSCHGSDKNNTVHITFIRETIQSLMECEKKTRGENDFHFDDPCGTNERRRQENKRNESIRKIENSFPYHLDRISSSQPKKQNIYLRQNHISNTDSTFYTCVVPIAAIDTHFIMLARLRCPSERSKACPSLSLRWLFCDWKRFPLPFERVLGRNWLNIIHLRPL